MFQHRIELTINAISDDQAKKVKEALSVIVGSISATDIIWVGDKIKEDPNVIKKVIKISNNKFVKNLF